jgi:hypothetical protein
MGTVDLEANPEAVEGQELHIEEAEVDTIGSLEDQYMDWYLVVQRFWQLKQAQVSNGFWQKLDMPRHPYSVQGT